MVRPSLEVMLTANPPATERAAVLADIARTLADRLDGDLEDRHAAVIAKELRNTIDALDAAGGTSDAFDELAKRLSAQVGDATN